MNKLSPHFTVLPTLTALSVALPILTALQPIAAHADVVTEWNSFTFEVVKAAGLNSNLGTRVGAIESIAVYDAANAVGRFGTAYAYNSQVSDPASAEAAVSQAAHDVLVSLIPAQQAAIEARFTSALAAIPDGPEKTRGSEAGAAAAKAILALRANDGSSPNQTYAGPANPGVGEWRPTPGAAAGSFPPGINQQWGGVTPFVLPSSSIFRSPAPPTVGSPEYTAALSEVRDLGSITSTVRTSDQTHVSQFYKQDAELLVNEATRILSASHGLGLTENALLFALVNIALADARIAIWESKYHYKYWRPVTALNANEDGSITNNYSSWNPLLVTPAHPSYPSGHSGTVNAGIEVLKDFFGNRKTLQLKTTTPAEPSRIVASLQQIEIENGLSRIYGGIHFSFDNVEGQALGNKVATYVLQHGPQAIQTSTSSGSIIELNAKSYPGIRLSGPSGQSFRIEYSDSITPNQWTPWRFITLNGNDSNVILDTSGASQRFYRAVTISNTP